MLYRSCPRFRSASVIWNGSSFTGWFATLPVKNPSSSCSVPRATVPSTSGRALEPSAKRVLGRSGRYFGWLCMSCRQPAAATRQNAAARSLRLDLIDFPCSEALEKCPSPLPVEAWIVRFDRQEQAVLARMFAEALDVEHRVVRHRQPVHQDHRQDGREGSEEYRHIERHRDERRSADERHP